MKKLKLDRITSNRFDVNELSKIKGGIIFCACGPYHPCYCEMYNDASDLDANNQHSKLDIKNGL
ncbi:MAG: hypothetical protein HXX16_18875 [Bacteroidales bacterium]|nr:hypothetical protein [Bacteroidales bacterium]